MLRVILLERVTINMSEAKCNLSLLAISLLWKYLLSAREL